MASGNFFDSIKNTIGDAVALGTVNYITGTKIDAAKTAVALNPNVIPTNQPANQVLAPATTYPSNSESFFAKNKYLVIGGGVLVGGLVLFLVLRK